MCGSRRYFVKPDVETLQHTRIPCLALPGWRLKRSARAVQLFGRLAAVEAHTLWYLGHHSCLVVGSDVSGIWLFWIFTLFQPFPPFCPHFLLVFTTSPPPFLYVDFSPPWGPQEGRDDVLVGPFVGFQPSSAIKETGPISINVLVLLRISGSHSSPLHIGGPSSWSDALPRFGVAP